MDTLKTTFTFTEDQESAYSELGFKVYALLRLLKEEGGQPYKQLVVQSKEWAETGVIPERLIKPLSNAEELSNALRHYKGTTVKISTTRVKQVYKLLGQMCELYGYRIKSVKVLDGRRLVQVQYEQVESHAEILERVNPNRENLTAMGLVDVIAGTPIQDADFQTIIMEATEIRILQSAFYKNRLIMETLSKAIEKGKLRSLKILLAQPYSQAARDRAHTYKLNGEEQFAFFNFNVMEAISGLVALREKSRDKETKIPKVDIQLGLYSRSPVIPVYQCFDEKGNNLLSLIGIFWRNHSSFDRPHFKIKGNRGTLLGSINDHFDEIWNDTEELENRFNSQKLLENRRTLIVTLEYNEVRKVEAFLRESSPLKMFFSQGLNRTAQWTYFKCFYYNFKNEERHFLLKVDTTNGVASINETHNKSSYSGIIVKLHNSYSLFLHSTDLKRNNRIITLSIPVGGTELADNQQRFAIYSNNDVDSGSPYSQMMLLVKFDVPDGITMNTEAFTELFKKVKVTRDHYSPYLKERKIHLRSELWYKSDLRVDQVPNNYYQYFESRERRKYFDLLMRELKNAKSEVYFIGYAPETSAKDEHGDMMQEYYELHHKLIEEKNIKIHRVLLDRKSVNGEFKEYLHEMFSATKDSDNFRLYASDFRIPILNDTILIDPESADHKKIAILSFMQERKGDAGSVPNRLEVIKENPTIVENLHNTCLEFIAMKTTIKRCHSLEEFNAFRR